MASGFKPSWARNRKARQEEVVEDDNEDYDIVEIYKPKIEVNANSFKQETVDEENNNNNNDSNTTYEPDPADSKLAIPPPSQFQQQQQQQLPPRPTLPPTPAQQQHQHQQKAAGSKTLPPPPPPSVVPIAPSQQQQQPAAVATKPLPPVPVRQSQPSQQQQQQQQKLTQPTPPQTQVISNGANNNNDHDPFDQERRLLQMQIQQLQEDNRKLRSELSRIRSKRLSKGEQPQHNDDSASDPLKKANFSNSSTNNSILTKAQSDSMKEYLASVDTNQDFYEMVNEPAATFSDDDSDFSDLDDFDDSDSFKLGGEMGSGGIGAPRGTRKQPREDSILKVLRLLTAGVNANVIYKKKIVPKKVDTVAAVVANSTNVNNNNNNNNSAADKKRPPTPSETETIYTYMGDTREMSQQVQRGLCSMRRLRSKRQKLDLLDLCLLTIDDDILLAVILFLKETLNYGIFLSELKARQRAFDLYLSYVKKTRDVDELFRIYRKLNMKHQEGMLMIKEAFKTKNNFVHYEYLEKCVNFCQAHESLRFHAVQLTDCMNILSRQAKIEQHDSKIASMGQEPIYKQYPRFNIVRTPLATTLYYCSFYHWYADKSKLSSPLGMKEFFSISEKRYLWTALKARAKIGDWASVQSLPKSTFSLLSKNSKKSAIGFHPFVETTLRYGGPRELVDFFMMQITDDEERLEVAKRYGLWHIAIQVIIKLKDRERLVELRAFLSNHLPPDQSAPFRNQIDDALNNTKWRSSLAKGFSLRSLISKK